MSWVPGTRKRPKSRSQICRLLREQNGRCWWCAEPMIAREATRDHYKPKSKGGNGKDSNTVVSCLGCNAARGNDETWEPHEMMIGSARYFALEAAGVDLSGPERKKTPPPDEPEGGVS